MTRRLYRLVLWMHPTAFRQRFRDEMLSIFDEAGARRLDFALLLDAILSLARQWFLRTDCWKLFIAFSGAYIQVWGFGLPTKGHQSWAKNDEAFNSNMQGLILITLALICSLTIMLMSLTVWTMRFQRRRSEVGKLHSFRVAGTRHPARLVRDQLRCSKFAG